MVGEILKKRREELGRDLRDISNILKIKHDYLKSIEDDAFDKLPESVYVKGYIREYAEFLNIDAETVLKAYTEQVSTPAAENKTVPETEAPPRRKTRARTLVISLILVLFAVIVLFLVSPFAPSKEDTSPPLKGDDLAGSADKPVVETPLHDERKTISSSSDSEPSGSFQPPPEMKKEFVPTADQSPHVLEIIADDITWLAITTDEAAPKEVMMYPGETLKVNANKNISLKIGNAGGVKLVFNGKEIRNLGEKGEVITIHLPGSGT